MNPNIKKQLFAGVFIILIVAGINIMFALLSDKRSCEKNIDCFAGKVEQASQKIGLDKNYTCGLMILPDITQTINNCKDSKEPDYIPCYLNFCNSDEAMQKFFSETNYSHRYIFPVVRVEITSTGRNLVIDRKQFEAVKCFNEMAVTTKNDSQQITRICREKNGLPLFGWMDKELNGGQI